MSGLETIPTQLARTHQVKALARLRSLMSPVLKKHVRLCLSKATKFGAVVSFQTAWTRLYCADVKTTAPHRVVDSGFMDMPFAIPPNRKDLAGLYSASPFSICVGHVMACLFG